MKHELTRWAYESLKDSGVKNIKMEATYWLTLEEPTPDSQSLDEPSTLKKSYTTKTNRTVVDRKRMPNDFLALTPNWKFQTARLTDRGKVFNSMIESYLATRQGRALSKNIRLQLKNTPPLNLTGPQVSQNVTDLMNAGILEVSNKDPAISADIQYPNDRNRWETL